MDASLLPDCPLLAYRARVNSGELKPDPIQECAAERLQSLHRAVENYTPESGQGGWKARFGLSRRRSDPPQGLYIYGGVGRGKSMLMDVFFRTAPVDRKRRVHFHAFMQEVHASLNDIRAREANESLSARSRTAPKDREDVLRRVASKIADKAWLLCFDELQVLDIADAMILGRLFEALFDLGVVVVATSNRPPQDLYKDGLQRALFLPFIDLIRSKMDVLELDNGIDYRLDNLRKMDVYLTPRTSGNLTRLRDYFAKLTEGAAAGPEMLPVNGRSVEIPMASGAVAFATFKDLCQRPLGPADYLAIANRFDVLVLADIPQMGPSQRNEAKRFVTLIDALYEHRVKLMCLADSPIDEIYPGGDGAFEFERTASRLHEMSSHEYLGSAHIA